MRRRVLLIGLGLASTASALDLPYTAPGDVPLPEDARSIEIERGDEPLRSEPRGDAPRRGSAARGARLPLFAAIRGPGCDERWYMVGASAWVCGSHVRASNAAPLPAAEPRTYEDGLPHRYFFVGQNGSLGYPRIETAEEGAPSMELQPGFAVAVVRQGPKPGTRDLFGLTTHGLWLPLRDLGAVRPEPFHGEELIDGHLDFAWVVDADADTFRRPNGSRVAGDEHVRFERVPVLSTVKKGGKTWVEIGPDRWLREKDVRRPTAAAAPLGVLPGERWIDVDIAQQVLVAYEGERAVFATLVSTGKGKDGSEQATPRGEHRVWVKLRSSDMDNLESQVASSYYAIQDVPWVMFFERGYGLHGTFWHHGFGAVRSHGCVNLTPLDAQRLFNWSSPRLPSGWTAVLPTELERGTLVRVR